ncbi:MAG: hypothetical protein O8C64_14800 [Candidatus Methanoperedens sp.]|nr:hypothetical protein [Candidatus Methanoperedens sp.]
MYVSYETAASSGQQIFIVNPDGSGKKLLFKDGFRQLNPMWSRDGTKIVYTIIDPQGNQTFMVLNLQKPAATTQSPTPTITPTATGITTSTPTPTVTPEIKETPVKSTINNVVSSMLLVLGLIVVVMLVILFISNLMNKKK